MYRRAFSTLGCGHLPLAEVHALRRRFALAGCELRALGGSLDLARQLAAQFGSPAAFATDVGAQGVVALDSSCNLTSDAALRDSLLALALWADAGGIPWLRVFDGGRELDDAQAVAAARTFLEWWRTERAARGLKVDVMIETHDRLLNGTTIARWLDALGPLRPAVLWDAHHTWRKGGEDPLQTWAAIRADVAHIHVKDSRRDHSTAGYGYVLPGDGEFPMAALRAVLAAEFPHHVSLEWERWWHPHLPPLELALQAAVERHWW